MKHVFVERLHRLTQKQIQKYPQGSLWVDIWHLGFPNPDGTLVINIKQSSEHNHEGWQPKGRNLGYKSTFSLRHCLQICLELMEFLGIAVKDFSLYGSTLGNSEWFRQQLTEIMETR